MTTPTPGPWNTTIAHAGHVKSGDVVLFKHAHDAYPGRVSGQRGHFSAEQRMANARLAAAAPEMRDALNYLLRAYIEATTGHPDDAIRGSLIAGVREVMRKVDGRE